MDTIYVDADIHIDIYLKMMWCVVKSYIMRFEWREEKTKKQNNASPRVHVHFILCDNKKRMCLHIYKNNDTNTKKDYKKSVDAAACVALLALLKCVCDN